MSQRDNDPKKAVKMCTIMDDVIDKQMLTEYGKRMRST